MENFEYIKRNYIALREEIDTLASRLGYPAPTLVSVTKSGTDEELIALAEAGATDVGENRPGEVKRRGEILRGRGMNVRMHEIGTLQRNKIKLIIDSVHLIHSIDSVKLAYDVNRLAEQCGRVVPVLIEVNSAREENKSGIFPEDAERLYEQIADMKSIRICGLMTMGPVCENPEDIRPYFRETKQLFDRMAREYGFGESPILSMGMSDSYRQAIEEGSTLVRVGRRLFIK